MRSDAAAAKVMGDVEDGFDSQELINLLLGQSLSKHIKKTNNYTCLY